MTYCNFVIEEPIWKGRKVGLNEAELTGDRARVRIMYKRKSDGKLEFPHIYELDVDKILKYKERQKVKQTWVRIIPISAFDIITNPEQERLL